MLNGDFWNEVIVLNGDFGLRKSKVAECLKTIEICDSIGELGKS